MVEQGLVKTAIDAGLSVGIFGLCSWMVVTIVTRLCAAMDKLVTKLDRFTDRVKDEHDRSETQHDKMMVQHEGMIESLGRINGFKDGGI